MSGIVAFAHYGVPGEGHIMMTEEEFRFNALVLRDVEVVHPQLGMNRVIECDACGLDNPHPIALCLGCGATFCSCQWTMKKRYRTAQYFSPPRRLPNEDCFLHGRHDRIERGRARARKGQRRR